MLQRLALPAFVAGTLLTILMPATGLAQNRGGNSGGRANSNHAQSSRGGNRGFAPRGGGNRGSEGRSFASPRVSNRGYDNRGYVAPRSYARPVYRGSYGSNLYFGYAAPYGYAYDPGYYAPGYAAPAPQACAPGSYDQNGNWIPNPNCSNPQQYVPQQQQDYNYNQQPYPQQQPNYDPNQGQGYNR